MRLIGPTQEHFQDLSILVLRSCYGCWCNPICGRPLHRRTTSLYFTPVYSNTASLQSNCYILVHHFTSSLIIADTDSQGRPNTPANDHWELQLSSRPVNDQVQTQHTSHFFPMAPSTCHVPYKVILTMRTISLHR